MGIFKNEKRENPKVLTGKLKEDVQEEDSYQDGKNAGRRKNMKAIWREGALGTYKQMVRLVVRRSI